MKSSLRLVIAGGHAFSHADRVFLEDAYGVPLVSYYGTSETGAISLDGQLMQGCEARINEGHVQIRTAGLANGYLGGTHLLMNDGWFVTPDKGVIEDERLTCLGRA
jgi:long-subunit acyl-CoA synthetase (AMP-forming)